MATLEFQRSNHQEYLSIFKISIFFSKFSIYCVWTLTIYCIKQFLPTLFLTFLKILIINEFGISVPRFSLDDVIERSKFHIPFVQSSKNSFTTLIGYACRLHSKQICRDLLLQPFSSSNEKIMLNSFKLFFKILHQ